MSERNDSSRSRRPGPPPDSERRGGLETTSELLDRARDGDRSAVEQLCSRYLPRLQRLARGRLPRRARDLLDTGDISQEVLVRTIRHAEGFLPRTPGGFNAYLRQALTNRIRDELRRIQRSPEQIELEPDHPDSVLTPLEYAIGRDQAARYETALAALAEDDREAIVARVEMQCSYEEIADLLRKPSANAARMAVVRALERLARRMRETGGQE